MHHPHSAINAAVVDYYTITATMAAISSSNEMK